MTPEERDRLRTVEVEVMNMKVILASIADDVAEIKEAAHMGKGAWLLLLKLGAVLGAIVAAVAWMVDRFAGRHP
jgi:hypothetical protein